MLVVSLLYIYHSWSTEYIPNSSLYYKLNGISYFSLVNYDNNGISSSKSPMPSSIPSHPKALFLFGIDAKQCLLSNAQPWCTAIRRSQRTLCRMGKTKAMYRPSVRDSGAGLARHFLLSWFGSKCAHYDGPKVLNPTESVNGITEHTSWNKWHKMKTNSSSWSHPLHRQF